MRAVNRVLGLLLGILLLAAGVVTIIETVALWVWHRAWPLPVRQWRTHLSTVEWADRRVLAASLIVLVAGLLLLFFQLRRARPARLRTSLRTDDETWVVQRHSVERRAANAARSVRGVHRASANAGGNEAHWHLDVAATADAGNVVDTEHVQQVVEAQLRQLATPEDIPVRVTVRTPAAS